jgi:hypothetical protein
MPLCMCKAAGDEATHIVSLLHALNLLCEIECSTLWSIHSSYSVSLHCNDVISCSSRISSSCALTNCERKLPIWQALRRWWDNIWAVFLTFSVRIPYIVAWRLHTRFTSGTPQRQQNDKDKWIPVCACSLLPTSIFPKASVLNVRTLTVVALSFFFRYECEVRVSSQTQFMEQE